MTDKTQTKLDDWEVKNNKETEENETEEKTQLQKESEWAKNLIETASERPIATATVVLAVVSFATVAPSEVVQAVQMTFMATTLIYSISKL